MSAKITPIERIFEKIFKRKMTLEEREILLAEIVQGSVSQAGPSRRSEDKTS